MLARTYESVVAIGSYYYIYLLVLILMHILVTFLLFITLCRGMIDSRDLLVHTMLGYFLYLNLGRSISILPLVDLVGRPWLSPTIPTGTCYLVVLTPLCDLLFKDSCSIHRSR